MLNIKKPLVLVTAPKTIHSEGGFNITIRSLYAAAVIKAGGMPAASFYDTRHCALYAETYDALLLTGGGDVNPALYGKKQLFDDLDIDDDRDALELALFDAFFARQKPIFGICRGIQLINVAFGGTLRQKIESGAHMNTTHQIDLRSDFLPFDGKSLTVNSAHNQAVSKLGSGLKVCAVSPDGVIEAIYHESAPVFGVQWHPERMITKESPEMLRLFQKYLDYC